MNLKFTGKVTFISQAETGTGKKGEWTKTKICVEEAEGQYPNSMVFDAFNKADEIKNLSVGCIVDVLYNAKCTENNGKYYNGLNIWKIEYQQRTVTTSTNTTASEPVNEVHIPDNESDLPFN